MPRKIGEIKPTALRRGDKTSFQIWWDDQTRAAFTELVRRYDKHMPVSVAILKLVDEALEKYYLPGYAKKDRPNIKVIANKMGEPVIVPKNPIDIVKD